MTPRVTYTLIAINVLVFIVMALAGVSPLSPTPEQLLRWGASYGPYDLAGDWWRLFSSMFVHIGIIHILLNMYCLASLGPVAENLFGSLRFLALYLLSGVAGAIASAGFHPHIVSAGASGAIFGVAGALVAVIYVGRNPLMESARGRLSTAGIGTFVAYNLIYGFANAGIDNAAHIGGLAAGFLIALTLPVGQQSVAEPERPFRTGLVFLASTVALVTAFLGVRQLRHETPEFETARQELLGGKLQEATDRLERVVSASPSYTEAHWLLGGAYLEQARPDDAVRELKIALQQRPGDTLVLDVLASAYMQLKQWEPAVATLRQQTSLSRRNATAWANLGHVFVKWGRPTDAIEPYQHATELAPQEPSYWYFLGDAYVRAKKFEPALTALARALALAPSNPYALLLSGYCHLQLGHKASARTDFQAILDLPPGTADATAKQQALNYLALLDRQ